MTQKAAKPARPKKFQVFVGKELQAENNIYAEAMLKVRELQDQNVPEIKLVNHVYKIVLVFTKGNSEQNYRIVDGEYDLPTVE